MVFTNITGSEDKKYVETRFGMIHGPSRAALGMALNQGNKHV